MELLTTEIVGVNYKLSSKYKLPSSVLFFLTKIFAHSIFKASCWYHFHPPLGTVKANVLQSDVREYCLLCIVQSVAQRCGKSVTMCFHFNISPSQPSIYGLLQRKKKTVLFLPLFHSYPFYMQKCTKQSIASALRLERHYSHKTDEAALTVLGANSLAVPLPTVSSSFSCQSSIIVFNFWSIRYIHWPVQEAICGKSLIQFSHRRVHASSKKTTTRNIYFGDHDWLAISWLWDILRKCTFKGCRVNRQRKEEQVCNKDLISRAFWRAEKASIL